MFRNILKQILYSNVILKHIAISVRDRRKSKLYWVLWKLPTFRIKKIFRLLGICDPGYKKLKTYKDIHKGERCFIIATGPSLTISDLSKLKNEITFGMNSLCKIFSDLGWETTYYVIQDRGAFNLLKNDLVKLKKTILFHGDIWFQKKDFKNFQCKIQKFPRYYEHHGYDQIHLRTGFSRDIFEQVFEAYTVAVCTLQIAAYMGFSEIYLLGADCNYDQNDAEKSYSQGLSYNGINDAAQRKTFGNKMLYAYSVANQALSGSGIKVYNATRGGMLEEFQRVDFDSLF